MVVFKDNLLTEKQPFILVPSPASHPLTSRIHSPSKSKKPLELQWVLQLELQRLGREALAPGLAVEPQALSQKDQPMCNPPLQEKSAPVVKPES